MELEDLEEKYRELEAEKANLASRQEEILLEEDILSELIEAMRDAKAKYQEGMAEVKTEIIHPLIELSIIRRSICLNHDFKTKYPELQKRNAILADACQKSGIGFAVREDFDIYDNHKRRLVIAEYTIPVPLLGKSSSVRAQIL